MANGMWLVPLSRVLNSHNFGGLRPLAYATTALAAFVSPLLFGAMADRHASPVQVLRWLASASALGMVLASWSIAHALPAVTVLVLIQIYALFSVPTNSITTTIVFSRLHNSQRQFGPLRAVATLGWMCGCWLISSLNFDASTRSGYTGAAVWVCLAAATWFLPSVPPPPGAKSTFQQRMGWDALVLLKQHDHRVVFFTAALFSIPLAAFYPFTPPHLSQLGFQHTTALMSLGQITEIISMLSLAMLLNKSRLKWIFMAGLAFGVMRFSFCAQNSRAWLLLGVTLHGFSFTLFFITAQIYLNERIEQTWRARAQALMSLMTSGVGNLVGYLGTGLWFTTCTQDSVVSWSIFWDGLAGAVACVLLFFLITYHGRSAT